MTPGQLPKMAFSVIIMQFQIFFLNLFNEVPYNTQVCHLMVVVVVVVVVAVVVHGASRPLKILQYLAKLIARRRVSFVICCITFKTRISFKKHTKGVHPCNVCEKAFQS